MMELRTSRRARRVLWLGVAAAAALTIAACGSSSTGSGGSSSPSSGTTSGGSASGAGSPVISAAQAAVSQHLQFPTKIQETEKFALKPGKTIFNVSCNLAIVGCGEISSEIGDATKAIGYHFGRCNAGATQSQAQGCFTNAVNAKASVIVDNDVPLVGSGSG